MAESFQSVGLSRTDQNTSVRSTEVKGKSYPQTGSFANLLRAVDDVVGDLQSKSSLWHEATSKEYSAEISSLASLLNDLEGKVDAVESYIDSERQELVKVESLVKSCNAEQQAMAHIANHFPSHVPGAQPQLLKHLFQQENVRPLSYTSRLDYTAPAHLAVLSSASGKVDHVQSADVNRLPEQKLSGLKSGAATSKGKAKAPRLYITKDELDSCSSYLVGRLTQERINCAMDELARFAEKNNRMEQKMRGPGTSISQVDKGRIYDVAVILKKNGLSKGAFWFTEYDMRNGTHIKCDKSGKGTLQLLRHLKRVSEIRGTIQSKSEVVYIMSEAAD